MPKKTERTVSTERVKRSGQSKPKTSLKAEAINSKEQEVKVENNHDNETKENTQSTKTDIKKTKNPKKEVELESTDADQAKKPRGRASKISIEHW